MNGLEEALQRDWYLLYIREHGPLAFRMILQPTVAAALAIRSGLRDAREGNRPFAVALAADPTRRRHLLRGLWEDIGRLFLIAVAVDVIYQIIVFRTVYPVQALVVAALLALPTYVVARGLTNRVARRNRPGQQARQRQDEGPTP